MKVLIAEDDKDQLFVRGLLLRQNGFETIETADAAAAIKQAKTHRPECALIDLRLPTKETGLKLIRELKHLDSRMHVFVLTGEPTVHLEENVESGLIDAVIVKGSPSRQLIQKLRAVCGR